MNKDGNIQLLDEWGENSVEGWRELMQCHASVTAVNQTCTIWSKRYKYLGSKLGKIIWNATYPSEDHQHLFHQFSQHESEITWSDDGTIGTVGLRLQIRQQLFYYSDILQLMKRLQSRRQQNFPIVSLWMIKTWNFRHIEPDRRKCLRLSKAFLKSSYERSLKKFSQKISAITKTPIKIGF